MMAVRDCSLFMSWGVVFRVWGGRGKIFKTKRIGGCFFLIP